MLHKHTIYWKFPDRYLYLWVYLCFDKRIFTGYDKQTCIDYRLLFEAAVRTWVLSKAFSVCTSEDSSDEKSMHNHHKKLMVEIYNIIASVRRS